MSTHAPTAEEIREIAAYFRDADRAPIQKFCAGFDFFPREKAIEIWGDIDHADGLVFELDRDVSPPEYRVVDTVSAILSRWDEEP